MKYLRSDCLVVAKVRIQQHMTMKVEESQDEIEFVKKYSDGYNRRGLLYLIDISINLSRLDALLTFKGLNAIIDKVGIDGLAEMIVDGMGRKYDYD